MSTLLILAAQQAALDAAWEAFLSDVPMSWLGVQQ